MSNMNPQEVRRYAGELQQEIAVVLGHARWLALQVRDDQWARNAGGRSLALCITELEDANHRATDLLADLSNVPFTQPSPGLHTVKKGEVISASTDQIPESFPAETSLLSEDERGIIDP